MTRRVRRPFGRALYRAVTVLACGAVPACGGSPAEAPASTSIDRETFIATYVELRVAAVRGGQSAIQDEQRADILQRHGVTEQSLFDFVSANGEDVDYMRQVWDEVERRLDALPLTDDAVIRP